MFYQTLYVLSIHIIIRVGETLFRRINKHVNTLKKCLENDYSRSRWINEEQKWLVEALSEKLEEDKQLTKKRLQELIKEILWKNFLN